MKLHLFGVVIFVFSLLDVSSGQGGMYATNLFMIRCNIYAIGFLEMFAAAGINLFKNVSLFCELLLVFSGL